MSQTVPIRMAKLYISIDPESKLEIIEIITCRTTFESIDLNNKFATFTTTGHKQIVVRTDHILKIVEI